MPLGRAFRPQTSPWKRELMSTDDSSAPQDPAEPADEATEVPDPADTEHPAGEQQAAENAENESAG